MGSARLPAKALAKIGGKPMIWHVIERAKLAKNIDKIIVATTDLTEDKKIIEVAEELGVKSFAGSENDVLDRYCKAAKKFNADIIVRVTGDCPLIDHAIIDEAVSKFKKIKCDYLTNDSEFGGHARGFDVDIFSLKILEKIAGLADKDYFREHITTFMLGNPKLFNIAHFKAPLKFYRPDYRLCVDEKKDLILVKKVFNHFKPREDFNMQEIIEYLDSDPKTANINKKVKQKNIRQEKIKEDVFGEISKMMSGKSPSLQKDWDLIWPLSGPEDDIRIAKENETRDRLKTALNLGRKITAVRLNKDVKDVFSGDILKFGPDIYYNGSHLQNENLKDNLVNFCKENKFPEEKIIISNSSKISNTLNQLLEIPKEVLQGRRTIVIISDVYHLPRVKRYINGLPKKFDKEKIVLSPAEPKKAADEKISEEINKISKYTKKNFYC